MSDTLYHIKVSRDAQLPRYMVICGDPKRAKWIAEDFLNETVEIAHNREYWSFIGQYKGIEIAISSMGIGCPSTAIGLEEFGLCGVDTFIRVGTAGSLQKMPMGSIVNATGAIRDEGTSTQYVPLEYPAVASVDIVLGIREAAKQLGIKIFEGLVHSKDAFYSEHPEYSPNSEYIKQRWKIWERGNVMATEMESSLLFVLAQLRKWRAGTVLAVIGSTQDETPIAADPNVGQKEAIQIALEGIKNIYRDDQKKAKIP
ncbi:MAG: nucleoside phosphorylase [Candidatus Hodarchaeales archaeon]|jgi:uridine phosphorylase